MIEIKDNIYYVGVNDRNKELFEGLWPLPNGVSYNSYLIVDEKVCLVDTVDDPQRHKIDCIVVRDKHAGAPYTRHAELARKRHLRR